MNRKIKTVAAPKKKRFNRTVLSALCRPAKATKGKYVRRNKTKKAGTKIQLILR